MSSRVRVILATLLTLALSIALVPLSTIAASAAPGDYTVEITAPASVPIYDPFTYTATVDAEVTTSEPATGIVLTSVLAEGLEFDSAPTGSDSPIASYSYDAATRTVTFVLKDLTEQLSSFTFSVKQVDNSVKDASTVYDTSISGAGMPSAPISTDNAMTTMTGDNNYHPTKSYTTLEGSGNRYVTYYFNVATDNGNGNVTETFTSWSQTLTDTLPAGAVVTGTSTWGGAWTTTANGDGTTTAVWNRDGGYGPSNQGLDNVGGRIWISVNYPEAEFAEGALPPANQVDLTVSDHSGNSFGPTSAEVQSPALIDGSTKGIFLTKDADRFGNDAATKGNGIWQSDYLVKASYLNSLDSDDLASLTIEDSAAQSPENAAFYDHADVYRLFVNFNPALQGVAAPYTLEYTTSGSAGWNAYDTTGLTTADPLRLIVQTVGSIGFPENGYSLGIELPAGEHLTGWRVVVSPDDATSIPAGSEVRVQPSYVASFPALSDGAPPADPLTNRAAADGATVAGTPFDAADSAMFTVVDRVPIMTTVDSPSTLNVGDSASFVANISNLDPAGRSYQDSVMKVVLPVGVQYDATIGVTPQYATTPTGNVPVPVPGAGLTITTETVTDALGEHQVVVFTFDELPSLRTAGEVKNRSEGLGFRYTIPTTVLPQAYDATNTTTLVSSWAYTNDPTYASMRMDFYGPYYAADQYDFSAALDRIARAEGRPVVSTAGGLLLGKQVRAGTDGAWLLDAPVASPGTAQWQIYVANVLPQAVSNIVIFDRLPFVGDDRGTQFPVTVDGDVTGLPTGATVEYSTDATSVTTGSWTSSAVGATAFRVTVPLLGNGENLSLIVPTSVPAGVEYADIAVNNVTATGVYQGVDRTFASNDASISAEGQPAFTLVKKTNGVEYSAAPGALVAAGSAVIWTYEVTNTGDTPLDDIAISDAFIDGAGVTGTLEPTSTSTGPLEPGASRTFTATGTAVTGRYYNAATATATAVNAEGDALSTQPPAAADESWYLAGDAGLAIVKTTNGVDVDSAPGLPLTPGDDVTWEYAVTNTGTLPLTDVLVTDVDSDGEVIFTDTIGTLAPGETVGLSSAGSAIEGQYHNTVTATAGNPAGSNEPLSAADESWYFGVVSSIAMDKTVAASENGPFAEKATVTSGSGAWWQLVVTNTGNAPLADVVITDEALGDPIEVGDLEPGESTSVVVHQDDVTEGYTNIATVKGTDRTGVIVTDEDDAEVAVAALVLPGAPGLAFTGSTLSLTAGVLALALLVIGGLLLARSRRENA